MIPFIENYEHHSDINHTQMSEYWLRIQADTAKVITTPTCIKGGWWL